MEKDSCQTYKLMQVTNTEEEKIMGIKDLESYIKICIE